MRSKLDSQCSTQLNKGKPFGREKERYGSQLDNKSYNSFESGGSLADIKYLKTETVSCIKPRQR